MAGKDGFDEDDEPEEGDEGEGPGDGEDEGNAEDNAQPSKPAQPNGAPGTLKRHKKLAKAVLGKKLRTKRLDLAFEPAETEAERQLN